LVYVWTEVTTDGLITLLGKGRTGWLQHSSSFPVSQLLKCNMPAACLRNFDRESYRTNHWEAPHPIQTILWHMRQRLWQIESRLSSLHPLVAKSQKMRGTVFDRDLLGALGEGPWALLFFYSTKC